MKLVWRLHFLCLCLMGCATSPAAKEQVAGADKPASATLDSQAKKNDAVSNSKEENVFNRLEAQVTNFKKVYFTSSLPSLVINNNRIGLEDPISEHVPAHAFYSLENFDELISTQPPQKCQRLLLVSKSITNRKREMARFKKLMAGKTIAEAYNATTGVGVVVRVDNDLKIKNLSFTTKENPSFTENFIAGMTSEFGYPKEVDLPDFEKAYAWGIEFDKQKYFLYVIHFSASTHSAKKVKTKFTQILAYRKDPYSCADE